MSIKIKRKCRKPSVVKGMSGVPLVVSCPHQPGSITFMDSLRVIKLQVVAFVLVFSASGLVPLLDLAYSALISIYLVLLARFVLVWADPHVPGKWAFSSVRGRGRGHVGGPVPASSLCAGWVWARGQARGGIRKPTLVFAILSNTDVECDKYLHADFTTRKGYGALDVHCA